MESIVTQIVVKMVEEILKNFKENGFSDICTDSTRLMSIVNSNVQTLSEVDGSFLDTKVILQ